MSKRTSIGSWAFTIGPYAKDPIDFDTVCDKLKELGFDGVELGAFPPHPNPGNPNGSDAEWPGAMPDRTQREELASKIRQKGLAFSGIAANLWGEKLINTDDQSKYIAEFRSNSSFCRDLGIEGIRVDCVQPPTIHREVEYSTALKRVSETWKTCCDIASDAGQYVTWDLSPASPSTSRRTLCASMMPSANPTLVFNTTPATVRW
ncbi:MAG: TIM barrel protein [Bryobacteraceae bacterium]